MALIICPECNKEISDKSDTCIHCGFPIAQERARVIQEQKQAREQDWERRNQSAQQLPDNEAIPLFIELGNEGYLLGYINAGIYYSNSGDLQSAYDCYMKAYTIDPMSCDGLTAQKLGYLHARKDTSLFDAEKAIHYLKECKTLTSNRRLGQIYDPHYKNDGFDKYKDYELALEYYKKLLSDKHAPYIASVYNDIGTIFGDYYKYDIVASCYCLLAKRISNDKLHSSNYEVYISRVRNKGPIWEKNIQSIRSPEDIDPMIERVNAEIKASASSNTIRTSNGSPRCPTCGSDKIEKIGTLDRAFSTYMWGFFSKKIGKQFKCRSCGYLW